MNARNTLVRANVSSLYEQIAVRLRDEILSGRYEPSGKLPSEAELCARYKVSRVTVRLALDRLSEEGLVERKQGKGTYASGKQVRHGLDALRSFHDSLVMQGLKPSMQLISKELVDVPVDLQQHFGKRVARCLRIKRLHYVDDAPIALGISHLPAQLDTLNWDETASHPNYTLIQRNFGRGVANAEVSITAGGAEREVARLLEIKTGAPLLVMSRVSAFSDNSCCDYSVFYIRPERYVFNANCSFLAD